MIGYKDLIELCEVLSLDPNKTGGNNLDDSEYFIFGDTLDFKEEKASDELVQIMKIGSIVRNLFSQLPKFKSYNLAIPSGLEEQRRDSKIIEVCKLYQQIMLFYLQKAPGLTDRKFCVHYGRVYELNRNQEDFAEDAIQRSQKIIARYSNK